MIALLRFDEHCQLWFKKFKKAVAEIKLLAPAESTVHKDPTDYRLTHESSRNNERIPTGPRFAQGVPPRTRRESPSPSPSTAKAA